MPLKYHYMCRICDGEFDTEEPTEVCPLCGGEDQDDGTKWNDLYPPIFDCPFCDVRMEFLDLDNTWQECPDCHCAFEDGEDSTELQVRHIHDRLAIYLERKLKEFCNHA